jgi:hypothetical protein
MIVLSCCYYYYYYYYYYYCNCTEQSNCDNLIVVHRTKKQTSLYNIQCSAPSWTKPGSLHCHSAVRLVHLLPSRVPNTSHLPHLFMISPNTSHLPHLFMISPNTSHIPHLFMISPNTSHLYHLFAPSSLSPSSRFSQVHSLVKFQHKELSCHRRLITSEVRVQSKTVNLGFMVDKVTLGHVFPRDFLPYPNIIIPPALRTESFNRCGLWEPR